MSDSSWLPEAAALKKAGPKRILFLCVQNSARSQMAEGIARSMGPTGVEIYSAGESPTFVRTQAIEALSEIGINISGQTSKSVDDIDAPIDAVITLCAEGVCPVWMDTPLRIHWALEDPVLAEQSEEERMEAFREVRDEVVIRREFVFGCD